MANTILQKSLTSAATVPHATNGLKIAELGVNTYDGRVYHGTKVGASGTAGGESTAATWVGAPILDEDAMGSDSAVKLATQQSIKAYVDSNAGSGDITGVTLTSDSGTANDATANVDINILGGAGIDTSATGTTVTITGETANASNAGIVELATTAETNTGSDTARAVTPDGLNDWTGGAGAITKLGTIASGVWSGTALVAGALGADCVTAAKIGDNVINSEHYAAGSIDNEHIADDAINSEHYADGSIDNAHIADDAIDSEHYADGSIDNAHIADDAIDSEHYTNGSVDNVHLANDGITISTTDTSLGGTITFPTMSNVDMGGDFVIGNQSNDTCTISGHLTVAGTTTTTQTIAVGTADTIIFEGATADAYETTLTVVDPTAARTITLPNVTGTVVTTGDTATVTATMLAANSVDSSELVNGSVDNSHLAADSVDSSNYVDDSIDTAHYAAGSVDATALGADCVTAAKIGDDVINSEHYAAGSIDTAHIANDQITAALMADDSIDSAMYVNGSIDNAHIADDAIDSEHYVNGSVDNAHLANDGITIAGADTSLGGTISAATIASAIDSETMTLTNTTIDGGTYATS